MTDGNDRTPGDDEVLIKIVVAGSNPKDYKVLTMWVCFSITTPHACMHERCQPEVLTSFLFQNARPLNSGDDMAGYVEKVGKNVTEFKPGDRVAAFHEMMKPWGAFAEYGIAHAHTTFHIPLNVSFEEAATLPLAGMHILHLFPLLTHHIILTQSF